MSDSEWRRDGRRRREEGERWQRWGTVVMLVLMVVEGFWMWRVQDYARPDMQSGDAFETVSKDFMLVRRRHPLDKMGQSNVTWQDGLALRGTQTWSGSEAQVVVNRSSCRIVAVIPYFGSRLPAWFELFGWSVGRSGVDVLVVLSNASAMPSWLVGDSSFVLPHVSVVGLASEEAFCRLHASGVGSMQLWRPLCSALRRMPRQLIEFKPAIGAIFASYLTGYTHWVLADLDVAFGSRPPASGIVSSELDDFDVVTYSFGDQWRAYARGQWTMHRNVAEVNSAFRHCDYLTTRLKTRLAVGAHYESSEGCYSVALRAAGLRVKFAVNHFTDADTDAQQFIFLVDGQARRCLDHNCRPLVPARADDDARGHENPPTYVVEARRASPETICMRWVNPAYQPCLEQAWRNETVVLERNGAYYRLGRKRSSNAHKHGFETAAFFHFQEWKKQFRSFSARVYLASEDNVSRNQFAGSPRVLSTLATPLGFVPVPKPGSGELRRSLDLDVRLAVPSQTAVSALRCAFKSCPGLNSFAATDLITIQGNLRALISHRRENDVSLALTGILPRDLDVLAESAWRWPGPVIVTFALVAQQPSAEATSRFPQRSDVLVLGLPMPDNLAVPPLKALAGLAVDLAPTRFSFALTADHSISHDLYYDIRQDLGVQPPRGTTLAIVELDHKHMPPTSCRGSPPALSDRAYAAFLANQSLASPEAVLRHYKEPLTLDEGGALIVLDALDVRGDRRLVTYLDELGATGCYDGALVRSVCLHHIQNQPHLFRLAKRAFVTRRAAASCLPCPSQRKATLALTTYGRFLDVANALRPIADDEGLRRERARSSHSPPPAVPPLFPALLPNRRSIKKNSRTSSSLPLSSAFPDSRQLLHLAGARRTLHQRSSLS